MCDSTCRRFIVKKAKKFVLLNIFEFLRVWEKVESYLVYANNKLFWIAQPYFLTNIIKQS